ncbi:MAG TPA: PspA/IM30 family protein [Acidimicrobiales bacterium]|nr:PspA/IM30 family protein [Acidimicrobiales bacterium]
MVQRKDTATPMGAFGRLVDIIRAKVNKLLDRVEDPRDSLDLSYEKQVENLQKLRRGVAEVATARKRVELQAAALQQQADKLQGQARQALGQGREDLAREALTRRAALDGELAELHEQHEQISAQEQRLVETAGGVQSQVEAFRTKKETLKATYTAAEAQTRIGEAVAGISDSMGDAGAIMQRAQDKIADMQARAGAIDELLASGALTDLSTSTDDIQAQLDKVAAASTVDRELAALRAELGDAPAPAGLPSAPPAGADTAAAPGAPSVPSPASDQAEVTP